MVLGKTVIGVSALVLISYGLVSLVNPAIPSGFAGLEMSNGDAFAEVGAMYGGLQTGLGIFCLLALQKPDFYSACLALLALAFGTLALARLYSSLMATDAVTAYTYSAFVFEFAISILATAAFLKK